MRITTALMLLAATALSPVRVAAQDSETIELREQVQTLRSEIERLAARLLELEAQQERLRALAPPVVAIGAVPPFPPVGAAPVAVPVAAVEPAFEIAWSGAPVISGAGGWSFKPRGRLNFDAGFVDAPDSTGREDGFGSDIRRARLGVEGEMPGGFGYKFEVDFAGNETELADAIITYGDDGLTIRAGHHNTFQGLEELTSSRFSSFIERAAFTDAFRVERRLGLSAEYLGPDVLFQAGVFSDNAGDLPSKAWSTDARAVFLPRIGDTQLHLGASVHHADVPSGETVRYRQRPLVNFTSGRFIDTASLAAEGEFGAGLEVAMISGPFHTAGETFWQRVERPDVLADPTFFGAYAEVGYFLTPGDSRGYKAGVFDRTKPVNPLGRGGIGAIEVNLRYDHLDLTDSGIVGGIQEGVMGSIIWIPTAYTRLLFNYGILDYEDAVHPAGNGDRSYAVETMAMRAQIDF